MTSASSSSSSSSSFFVNAPPPILLLPTYYIEKISKQSLLAKGRSQSNRGMSVLAGKKNTLTSRHHCTQLLDPAQQQQQQPQQQL